MNFDESRGTFEDIIHTSAPAAAEIAIALRRLIQDLFEEVTEVPRQAEQHADYGIGAGRMGDVFVYICPVKAYVGWGFITEQIFPIQPECWLVQGKGCGT